ncbi:hypothetical protein GCM10027047_08880 [Rhodococcus aerolatus]
MSTPPAAPAHPPARTRGEVGVDMADLAYVLVLLGGAALCGATLWALTDR